MVINHTAYDKKVKQQAQCKNSNQSKFCNFHTIKIGKKLGLIRSELSEMQCSFLNFEYFLFLLSNQ